MDVIINSLLEQSGTVGLGLAGFYILIRHIISRSEQREERLSGALDKNSAVLLDITKQSTKTIAENTEVLRTAVDTISGLNSAISYCKAVNSRPEG